MKPQWDVIDSGDEPSPEKQPATSEEHSVAFAAVMLALKALSQRAIAALADLFCLFTVAGVWFLWWSIPDPNTHQIISLSIFAIFVLAANVIVRRMRG